MIPSLSSVASETAARPVPVSQAPTTAPPAASPVTVEISLSAQVKQLDASGSSVSEISLKTGLDAATVKLYLGQ